MNYTDVLLSIRYWMALLLLWPITTLAQPGEVFLNQGTLRGNPILLEDQRLLIQINDQVSFWDIDRNMLLKSYSAGNQFSEGNIRTQQIRAVSSRGKYLLTADEDSLYLYHTPTQTRTTLAHPFELDMNTTIEAWFTANEKTLAIYYAQTMGKKWVRVLNTETTTEVDTRSLNRSLANQISLSADLDNNQLYLFNHSDKILRLTFMDKPILDSFQIVQSSDAVRSWNNMLYWSEKDKIVLLSGQHKDNGVVALVDPRTGKLEKTFPLSFQASHQWHPDRKNGRIIVTADTYSESSFQDGYAFACIDLNTSSTWESTFKGVNKTMVSGYKEWMHRAGQFILRCQDVNKTWGINLSNRNFFQLPGDVKLNWITPSETNLLYRSQMDKGLGKYSVMDTREGKIKKQTTPYQYLHLSPYSQAQQTYVIRQYPNLRYELCYVDENLDSKPYKRLQLRPASLALIPTGKFGGKYYFTLGEPPKVIDDNLEFTEGAFTNLNQILSGADQRYFIHHLDSGRNQFVILDKKISDRLLNSAGTFLRAVQVDEYGYTEPDSLFLLDNNTGRRIAATDKESCTSLFGNNARLIADLYENVRFDRKKAKVILNSGDDLYLLHIKQGFLSNARTCNIQKTLAGRWSTMGLRTGFCNKDKNIYVIYRQNDSLFLHILDTTNLRSTLKYSTKDYGFNILPSPTSPHFLVQDKKGKKVELLGFTSTKSIATYHWGNQKWLFNDMSAYFSSAVDRFTLFEKTGEFGVYENQTGKRIARLLLPPTIDKGLGMPTSEVCYFLSSTGLPYTWNIREQKLVPFSSSGEESNSVLHTYIKEEDSLLITTSANTIRWWHLGKHRLFRTALLADTVGSFLGGDSGYYTINKNLFNEVMYRDPRGSFVSTIQQFDVLYNRPSYFIQSADPQLNSYRAALEQAYQKRLRRQGMSVKNSLSSLRCDLLNKRDLSTYWDDNSVPLRVGFSGNQGAPLYLHVLANGVPVYGQRGIPLTKGTTDTTINIVLTETENELVVFGTDAAGNSSNYFPIQLATSKASSEGRIHFLGIGIDQFADARYNLQFSSKDIRDLVKKLRDRFGDNVVIDTLFNQQVTADNIRKMKSNLLNTAPNDKVIVSYSGHGLLSKELDYYLSTYSIDFNEPQKGGLPYADLEDLLDNIPARNKLLLIDACHSGEIDREEGLTMQQKADSMGLTKGLIKESSDSKPKLGLQNSFELMRELFVNVGTGTGAMIISAAAGNQFALERGDLKNGVFTYSILEALDKFNTIKAGELRRYVSQRVVELTKGLQQPTVRNEKQIRDWSVW